MDRCFIPTAMSLEEMILCYKAVAAMTMSLMANKHRIKDPEALEFIDKYKNLKEKLEHILDLTEEMANYINEEEDTIPTYSEREKE